VFNDSFFKAKRLKNHANISGILSWKYQRIYGKNNEEGILSMWVLRLYHSLRELCGASTAREARQR